MTELRITIYGDAAELLIGKFPKEGADWILGYCEEFKDATDIEEVWYGEGFIPDEWSQGKNWDSFDNIFHCCGFRFEVDADLRDFLNNNLLQPAIEGIFIDDSIINYDPSKFNTRFFDIDLPQKNENDAFVYHGRVDRVSLDYIIDIDRPFFENNVEMHFVDCGEYGHMLTQICYSKKQIIRVFSGSEIKLGKGFFDLKHEELLKVYSANSKMIENRGFLDVNFF